MDVLKPYLTGTFELFFHNLSSFPLNVFIIQHITLFKGLPIKHLLQSLIISNNNKFILKHLLYYILRTLLVDPKTKINNTKRLLIKNSFAVVPSEHTNKG